MDEPEKLRVRVYHESYGCDTGCCGHVVEVGVDKQHFNFDHPEGDRATWARRLAEQTIRNRWPECLLLIDWSTLMVEASDE